MRGTKQFLLAIALLCSAVFSAWDAAAQLAPATADPPAQVSAPGVAPATEVALKFDISGTKFSRARLMRILKDSQHEGWVLAAYPDPKTGRALIGAGFSLDVEAREHVQSDSLNPNQFLEPSSAQLWQVSGLDPARLQSLLEQFDRNLTNWNKKKH